MGLPVQKSQEVHWKTSAIETNEIEVKKTCKEKNARLRCFSTVLSEFGGAEYGGDPEGLFGAPLEGQVGRQVGAAVEVLLAAGQAEVQALVAEGGVLIALKGGDEGGG